MSNGIEVIFVVIFVLIKDLQKIPKRICIQNILKSRNKSSGENVNCCEEAVRSGWFLL